MKKMLIDATDQSEIRLAVTYEQRLENYELESRPSKYTKGNVYLAKVVRVEPALQAAFVEYADNTQGFLPFSEIHPDYFRIPVEDYEALMAEQREERRQSEEKEDEEDGEDGEDVEGSGEGEGVADSVSSATSVDDDGDLESSRNLVFTPKIARRYKIQEVIKHGQLMLVQVAKEERGNKRAALSTYIALAGCYCVLIPNALFNGGVSRKIESAKERKRLKKLLSSIEVPEKMALILRTAAEGKTKASIGRELKYLQNLWDELRQRTMDSCAPLLIHEEGDLIKRSLRDIFSKQISEVHIAGEEVLKEAKAFTKRLNPTLSRSIIAFESQDGETLFENLGIESEVQSLILPEVQMLSGGALVIEQTEALVSIDVNSSKAIGERNIEETALKINLEAAEEVARQLRLRNLAGLIVIDFIDMERRANQQKVERVLKSSLKQDRARIHLGRISSFGLLEMSRQRMGPSLLEKTTSSCPQCEGRGRALHHNGMASALLRALRQQLASRGEASSEGKVSVCCLPVVAQELLNKHAAELRQLEERYTVEITFVIDAHLSVAHGWSIEDSGRPLRRERNSARGTQRRASQRRERKKDSEGEVSERVEGEQEVSLESEKSGSRRRRRSRRGGESSAEAEVPSDGSEMTESASAPRRQRRPRRSSGASSAPEAPSEAAKSESEASHSESESQSESQSENQAESPKPVAQPESVKQPEPVEQPEPVAAVVKSAPVVRGKPQPDSTAAIKPQRKGWWNALS